MTFLKKGRVVGANSNGLGLRVGANVGYVKFTPERSLNPFDKGPRLRSSDPAPTIGCWRNRLHGRASTGSPRWHLTVQSSTC